MRAIGEPTLEQRYACVVHLEVPGHPEIRLLTRATSGALAQAEGGDAIVELQVIGGDVEQRDQRAAFPACSANGRRCARSDGDGSSC